MKRALAALLIAAVVFTGWLLFTLVGPADRGRGHRASSAADAEPVRRDTPATNAPTQPGKRKPGLGKLAFRVTGRVTDTRGRGLAGAVVGVSGQTVRADGDGAYGMTIDSAYVSFVVYADGHLPYIAQTVFEGSAPWQKDFALQHAASLTGRVFDHNRRPVADARVYVISPDRALLEDTSIGNLAHTDRDGYYRFPGLPAGTWDLGVRAAGFVPHLREDVVVGSSGIVEVMLTLSPGRTVEVTVRNWTDGTRVVAADARIKAGLPPPGGLEILEDALVGREYADLPVVTTSTREDGRYVLRGVAPGAADIAALDERRITELGLGRVLDNEESRLTLTLLTAATIEIEVFDQDTRHRLEPSLFRTREGSEKPITVTFVQGMAIVPADRQRHTLHFRLQGYEETRLELSADSRAWPPVFEVFMRPKADGETGEFVLEFDKPIAQRVALVGRTAEGRRAWVKQLSEDLKKDKWTVSGIAFGEYQVSVLATGMIPVTLPRVVIAKGLKERHRVTLNAGGGIEMKITDASGKLLERVGVILRDAAGTQIDLHIMMNLSDRRAFVSVNSLPLAATARADSGLAPGAYSLMAYKAGYEPVTEDFVVRGTEVAKVTIALRER